MFYHWKAIMLPCFLDFAEKEATAQGNLHILLQKYYPVLFLFARDHLSISEGLGNEESIDWFVKTRLAEIENSVCQMKAIFMPTLSDCSPNPSPTSDARQQLCGSNTELDQDSYSAEESTHPISTKNEYLVQKMVDAMEDDSDTYDSESVLPYRKWRNMTRENYYDLALRITKLIDSMHEGGNDTYQGLHRQERTESLLALMKKCKGSVYKMAEPPFVEKCVRDPRKMEKIFDQNQKKRKRQPLEDGSEHCIPSGRITPCQPEQNLLRPLRKKRSVGESSYPACYTAGEVQDETAAEFQVHFQAECSNSEKSYLDTCYTGGDPKLLNAASGSDFINTASSSDFNTPPSTNNTGLLGYRSSTRQNKSFSQIPSTPAYSVLMPHQIEEILSPTDSINHDYQVRTQRGGISSLETLNSCPTSSPAMIGGSQQINPVFSFPSESP